MNIPTLSKEDRMTFDKEVERLLSVLHSKDPHSEEYAETAKNLKILCEARGIKTNRSVSMDVVVAAVANIVGIVMILEYEQVHVITSKAISLVFRGGRG